MSLLNLLIYIPLWSFVIVGFVVVILDLYNEGRDE